MNWATIRFLVLALPRKPNELGDYMGRSFVVVRFIELLFEACCRIVLFLVFHKKIGTA